MDHFVLQHMAEHFTRLIIISAGRYSKDIVSLAQRIGVTVLSIVEDAGLTAGIVQPSEEMIEISVDDLSKEVFRIKSGNPRQFNYRDESVNCACLHSW